MKEFIKQAKSENLLLTMAVYAVLMFLLGMVLFGSVTQAVALVIMPFVVGLVVILGFSLISKASKCLDSRPELTDEEWFSLHHHEVSGWSEWKLILFRKDTSKEK